jgi:hypothetical protein
MAGNRRIFFILGPFRIIAVGGNSRQIFEFKDVVRKILLNKELGEGFQRLQLFQKEKKKGLGAVQYPFDFGLFSLFLLYQF